MTILIHRGGSLLHFFTYTAALIDKNFDLRNLNVKLKITILITLMFFYISRFQVRSIKRFLHIQSSSNKFYDKFYEMMRIRGGLWRTPVNEALIKRQLSCLYLFGLFYEFLKNTNSFLLAGPLNMTWPFDVYMLKSYIS